tara:strand:+ start:41284 stop:41748 length:465 start_codon:yes stop_codon:yes gene_type:complete
VKYFGLILILFSASASTETTVKAFIGGQFVLPSNCYFIVRGGNENDFTCPSGVDRFRSVTFPKRDEVSERSMRQSANKINEASEEDSNDFRAVSVKSELIDDKKHYLNIWELGGIRHFSYTVCEFHSCVRISSIEMEFIENIVLQFSPKTISAK